MNISLVLPDLIVAGWSRYSHYIQLALDKGQQESTIVDQLRDLLNYNSQLWEIRDDTDDLKGIVLTRFLNYAQHKTLQVVLLSGNEFFEWIHLEEVIVKFAKDNGCVALESWGRPGWSKVLKDRGYNTVYHVLRKPI